MKPFFASVVLVLLGLQSTFPLFAETGDAQLNSVPSEQPVVIDERIAAPKQVSRVQVTSMVTPASGSTGSLIEYPE